MEMVGGESPKIRKIGKQCLVGGFKHLLFSIIYGTILPIDFHMFQDGYCTTNQLCTYGFFEGCHLALKSDKFFWKKIWRDEYP